MWYITVVTMMMIIIIIVIYENVNPLNFFHLIMSPHTTNTAALAMCECSHSHVVFSRCVVFAKSYVQLLNRWSTFDPREWMDVTSRILAQWKIYSFPANAYYSQNKFINTRIIIIINIRRRRKKCKDFIIFYNITTNGNNKAMGMMFVD
jgi:hypothetical protein